MGRAKRRDAGKGSAKESAAPPPPVAPGRLTYGQYLRVDDLLALQHPVSRPEHHDELQFVIVHQVFELWFRLLLHETDRVAAMLRVADDASLGEAVHLLRRVARILRSLQGQIEILDSMKPARFLGFRDVLEPASGFQSLQFREIECSWGLKDPGHAAHHAAPATGERLRRRLEAPSIRDLLGVAVRARGLDWPDGEGDAVADRRIAAARAVYEDPAKHALLEELFEHLVEVDASFALWRRHHVFMVERMIGRKWGTGGSQGVPYLETTLARRFFPELWAVRTHLRKGPASEAPPA